MTQQDTVKTLLAFAVGGALLAWLMGSNSSSGGKQSENVTGGTKTPPTGPQPEQPVIPHVRFRLTATDRSFPRLNADANQFEQVLIPAAVRRTYLNVGGAPVGTIGTPSVSIVPVSSVLDPYYSTIVTVALDITTARTDQEAAEKANVVAARLKGQLDATSSNWSNVTVARA